MERAHWTLLGLLGVTASAIGCEVEQTGTTTAALTGAIFTGLVDGSAVNQNLYDAKEDVYLDGGPGPGAPGGAAALPEGDYYFQVTDPSGKSLLSNDAIACRRIHVNDDGVIDTVYPGPGCLHLSGVDMDHDELGAITVQLMPYADTPNPGGVYKVWITAVGDYTPGSGKFGFKPSDSKTDNFKVDSTTPPPPPPPPCVCGNGIQEVGEECDDGNLIDNDGCSSRCTIELVCPPIEPTPT